MNTGAYRDGEELKCQGHTEEIDTLSKFDEYS